MKKIIMPGLLVLLIACGSKKEEGTETKTETKTASATTNEAPVTYAMPTLYNATWEMGDQKNAQTVMNVGKLWMSGDIDGMNSYFADSVQIYMSDGNTMIGTRDNVLASAKKMRSNYSEITADVHTILPMHHRDMNEDWVCIWLKERFTSNGKTDSIEVQEAWKFNKEGKIELAYQYTGNIKPVGK